MRGRPWNSEAWQYVVALRVSDESYQYLINRKSLVI